MDPVVLQLKMVTSFERRLAVNASQPPLARSRPSITGVALFVELREKRIRRKIIGKKTLKANTRNMYFMFAGCCLGGFGRRSPFEGCWWKYSGENLAIGEALFGGVLIDYRRFGPQEESKAGRAEVRPCKGFCKSPSRSRQMGIALELGDFVEAALVAAAEIGGGQESLHHFDGSGFRDDAASEGEDVSVVVFAGETCGCDVVREGGADAGAADRDAEIGLL